MITVLLFCHNDKYQIQEAIHSAKLLSESIIVIDIASTDGTAEFLKLHDVKCVHHPFTTYVEPTRDFGLKQVKEGWAFILDADERITPELAQEIKNIVKETNYTYFKVPRKEFFGKKVWLKHGGWWPNHQIRLIKTDAFVQWPQRIHSTPVLNGEMGYIKNAMLHYSKNDYEQIVEKTITFEDIESDLLFKANRNVSTFTFFRKYFAELYKRLFRSMGFLDGNIGIIESIYQAFSKTITYLYLYEKKKNRSL